MDGLVVLGVRGLLGVEGAGEDVRGRTSYRPEVPKFVLGFLFVSLLATFRPRQGADRVSSKPSALGVPAQFAGVD